MIYAITDHAPWQVLAPKIQVLLDLGLYRLQYRRKHLSLAAQQRELDLLLPLIQQYNTPLIINDHPNLAASYQCGLHLGQGDGNLVQARQLLGPQAIIGLTCHNSLVQAQAALANGASYIALGAVFPSVSKPQATTVALATLQQAVTLFNPSQLCVIGGINQNNALPLVQLGLRQFALISDLFNRDASTLKTHYLQWITLLTNEGFAQAGTHPQSN